MERFSAFSDHIYNKWLEGSEKAAKKSIDRFILERDERNILRVNYSPTLREVMEEAKHLTHLGKEDFPEYLQVVAGRSESLWRVKARLMDLCEDYNQFKQSTNNVELQLLSKTVQYIEDSIEQCCTFFKWYTVEEASVELLFERMRGLCKLIQEIQSNVTTIVRGIEKWGHDPFYNRRDSNPRELLDLQSRHELLRGRKMEFEKVRRQLSNAADKNRHLFGVDEGGAAAEILFEDYLQYVDGEVLSSLKWTVYQNLLTIVREMQRPGTCPLFEVKLVAKDNKREFVPSLEDPLDVLSRKTETFIYTIEMIIGDICGMADIIPRMAKKPMDDFPVQLSRDDEIVDLKRSIRLAVIRVIKDMKFYAKRFDKYNFLWTKTKDDIMTHSDEPKLDEFRENVS